MRQVRALLMIILMVSAACARDGTLNPDYQTNGLTRILLTDAPFPFDQVSRVDVFVVSVAATTSADTTSLAETWVTVVEPRTTFNLLELQSGTTTLIGESVLPADTYRAIRVVVDVSQSSVTLMDGSEAVVDWQGDGETALQALVEDPLDVPVDGAAIIIDFDVGRSFLPVGSGFLFIPWIRAVNEAATGSITGTVMGSDGLQGMLVPVNNASVGVYRSYYGAVPVATARTNASGEFLLPFVVEGVYTLQVDAPAGFDAGRAIEAGLIVVAGTHETMSITLPQTSVQSEGSTLSIHGKQSLDPGESAYYTSYLIEDVGDSVEATQTVWQTSNAAIASITGSGHSVTITGIGSGQVLISASCLGAGDSLLVTVGDAGGTVETVEVTPTTQTINVGDSTYVHATVFDANGVSLAGHAVTWSFSDSTIVSILGGLSSNYVVFRGLASGTLTVTATADGKSASGSVVIN